MTTKHKLLVTHKCEVYGVTYATPPEKAAAMVNAIFRAVDNLLRADGALPDGVVVPRVGACIAAVWAGTSLHPAAVHRSPAGFIVGGVPIFFAGADPAVEPFAISRRIALAAGSLR